MNDSRTRSEGDDHVTPMMAQYLEIKAAHPGCLLFYRMGDFYELFFADAEVAARTLGIALTRRGKHLGEDIPMCGVPVHAAGDYLQRLIRAGHRVAVCEQTEDPEEARRRGGKAVVARAVVRLVTPGTLTEDNLLEARSHNYLVALARVRGEGALGLAWVDISTGDFFVAPLAPADLAAELARLAPSEVIFPETLYEEESLARPLKEQGAALTPLPASRFDSAAAERRLKQHFEVLALEAYGELSRAEVAAAGSLIDYVVLTQVGRMPAIRPPRRAAANERMAIDAATRSNLELVRTLAGERRGSLVDAIDMTVTGPGGRLFTAWLSSPLTRLEAIEERLDAVSWLIRQSHLRERLRTCLRNAPDLDRALARLAVGRGSPRDLAALRAGLRVSAEIARDLGGGDPLDAPPALIAAIAHEAASAEGGLGERLAAVLVEEPPMSARDGGFVRPGALPALDEQRRLRDESRAVIAGLQARYVAETGIKSLKIRHNNLLGYYIEVAQQQGSALLAPPLGHTFVHRQTMANAMRFSTPELADLDSAISLAASRALALELELFEELAAAAREVAPAIAARAAALARLDVLAGLAALAEREGYVRPLVEEGTAFAIVKGRHPVVERALAARGETAFVPNDCRLSGESGEARIWLVTGPNMAGKSTFLRQNALIAVMAQMGSFVPAEEARIGIVDRLFSRVGAADDLARGRSTFMVEMVETATILNQAGPRSLVILDEIGRGTATFDGLSIAWAAVEHLHAVNRCRALFATHFHELTALAARLEGLANVSMKVREWKGEVIFLHEVGAGAADRSYGIQVARLAGLPPEVVARAGEVLALLERSEEASERKALIDDLPLFAAAPRSAAPPSPRGPSEVERLIDATLPDELTPREALDLLYRLKALRRA
jgi:DNA mismatch repair protein MutS